MAELQAGHSQHVERALVEADVEARRAAQQIQKRGQVFALLIALVSVGVGTYLATQDHDRVAGVVFATCAAALTGAFLVTRAIQPASPAEPAKQRTN